RRRAPPSPTRRSPDLGVAFATELQREETLADVLLGRLGGAREVGGAVEIGPFEGRVEATARGLGDVPAREKVDDPDLQALVDLRSEEHTSELQSRDNL